MKKIRCLTLVAAALSCAAAAGAQPQDELLESLTRSARTYGQVFERLSSPEVSQAVLEGLAAQDPQVFEALGDGLEVEDGLRCAWVKSAVEAWLKTPHRLEESCILRQDLTPEERWTYISIVRRHYKPTLYEGSLELKALDGDIWIPPGPFLDDLKAHNLVRCRLVATFNATLEVPVGELLTAYCYE